LLKPPQEGATTVVESPLEQPSHPPPAKKKNWLMRGVYGAGRWLKRCWLLAASIVIGGLLVLNQEALEKVFSPVDAKVVTWWNRITGSTADIHHTGNPRLLTSHFFGEVGIAFIVAGLVGMFVENTLRRQEERKREQYVRQDEDRHERQIAELKTNVFHSVLGISSPPWMAEKVIDLYRSRFLRQRLEITYTFEPGPPVVHPLDDHEMPRTDEIVTVSVHISYYLVNLCDTESVCEFGHGFEPTVPIAGNANRFTKLSVLQGKKPGHGGVGAPQPTIIGKRPGPEKPARQAPQELEWREGEQHECIECTTNAEEESLRWKSQAIAVTNFRIGATNKMKVDVHHQSVRWLYDHDTWVSRLPSESLRVIAKVESGVPELKFFLDQSHPKRFVEEAPRDWRLNDQILPYQGFTLHWFPAPRKVTVPTESTAVANSPTPL
jgi:hypothetical protein